MIKINQILRSDPNPEHISLSSAALTNAEFALYIPRLSKLNRLNSLALDSNRLTTLPDLSSLSRLTHINLTNNPFSNLQDVIARLRALPALNTLEISVPFEQYSAIFQALPNLQSLNNTSRVRTPPPQQPAAANPEPVSGDKSDNLTREDIQAVMMIFQGIKGLYGNTLTPEVDRKMSAALDGHIRNVTARLNERVSRITNPHSRKAEVLMAKHGLFDICFQELLNYNDHINNNSTALLRQLRAIHTSLFQSVPGTIATCVQSYEGALRTNQEESERELHAVIEAAETLERELEITKKELVETRGNSPHSRRGTMAANRRASNINQSPLPSNAHHSSVTALNNQSSPPPLPSALTTPPPAPPQPSGAGNGNGNGSLNLSTASSTPRTISLKQMKEHIEQIYESKEKYDKKCDESHLPRETCEQHMYTYLNQRYGLKSLIVDIASSILRGIQLYQDVDSDVKVFGKIFRNEIEESFRLVQQQLKATVHDLLLIQLKSENPLKMDDVIQEMLNRRESNQVYLEEKEWSDIIKYMYNENDNTTLTMLIRELINRLRQEEEANRRKLEESEAVPGRPRRRDDHTGAANDTRGYRIYYRDFVKLLLDFQLDSHQRFLHSYLESFTGLDEDHDGLINEAAFRTIIQRISPAKAEDDIQRLLEQVDPFNHQKITYSRSVEALAQDIAAYQAAVGNLQY